MIKNNDLTRYLLTINNEERTDEKLCNYVQGLEHLKYCIFQREREQQEITEHIHMFLVFTKEKDLSTIRQYFPTAYIVESPGTDIHCINYCRKKEGRISGPYEIINK